MQGDDKPTIRFHQLLEIQLNKTIKKFTNKPLTPVVMREIREAFKDQIQGIFSKSKYKLTENAVTWLTDQYFKSIKIDENQLMADTVVINEYKLSELELNDIELMRSLFNDTIMGPELADELARRMLNTSRMLS